MRSTGVRAGAMDVIPETPLSHEEIRELDVFLMSDATPDECSCTREKWTGKRNGGLADSWSAVPCSKCLLAGAPDYRSAGPMFPDPQGTINSNTVRRISLSG